MRRLSFSSRHRHLRNHFGHGGVYDPRRCIACFDSSAKVVGRNGAGDHRGVKRFVQDGDVSLQSALIVSRRGHLENTVADPLSSPSFLTRAKTT